MWSGIESVRVPLPSLGGEPFTEKVIRIDDKGIDVCSRLQGAGVRFEQGQYRLLTGSKVQLLIFRMKDVIDVCLWNRVYFMFARTVLLFSAVLKAMLGTLIPSR